MNPLRYRAEEIAHSILTGYARHFPISRGKYFLVSHAWRPLSFGRYQRHVVLRQAPVRLNCDLTMSIQRRLYFFREYEPETCDYWVRAAGRANTIFDVGASVGLYALLAAVANPRCQVHAFEATPEIARILAGNVLLNSLDNVHINHLAVGRAPGQAFLHRFLGPTGDNEGMNFVSSQQPEAVDHMVEMVSLDHYCQQRGIERIDLLKLDIEGGEYEALEGARRLLETRSIACIQVELAEWTAERSGHSIMDIKDLLTETGYTIHHLHSGQLGPAGPSLSELAGNAFAVPQP